MVKLHEEVGSAFEFEHLIHMLAAGTLDNEWVQRLSELGGYIVITGDGGRQSKKMSKLPEICAEKRVTHVVMSPKLHSSPVRERLGVLLTHWERIATLHDEPPGTRFDLRYRSVKGSRDKVTSSLDRVESPPPTI